MTHPTKQQVLTWHTELGEAWREAQTPLFDTTLSDSNRRAIQAALDRIERVRTAMRVSTAQTAE